MSALYSLRTTSKGFIVTKFDDDFNVESYYEMTQDDDGLHCGCPAGGRAVCRHRQMFPLLQTRVDTAFFLDFDTRAWVDPTGEAKQNDDWRYAANLVKDDLSKTEPMPKGQSLSEPILSLPDSHPFRRHM